MAILLKSIVRRGGKNGLFGSELQSFKKFEKTTTEQPLSRSMQKKKKELKKPHIKKKKSFVKWWKC